MHPISVIDNLLGKDELEELQNLFMTPYFPWYYNNCVNNPNDGNYQFTHILYDNNNVTSEHYLHLKSILIDKLDYYSIIRCKVNLLTKTEYVIQHGYHVDMSGLRDYHHPKTSIFYVNTNNGYTEFENGDIIQSVENRLVTFDSRMLHSGSTCTDENVRIVVNFNYF